MEKLTNIFKLLRVKHWSKSAFVFLGYLFSGLWGQYFFVVFLGAFVFALASSAIYLYNDLQDAEFDRVHPKKRHRFIASGRLTETNAYKLFFILNIAVFVLSFFISIKAMFIITCYFSINIAYSNGLKHIPVIDVLMIALGFMLRILMGTWAVGITPSYWILLCGTLLSLFLALSKRKLEYSQSELNYASRPVLRVYSHRVINVALMVISILFIASYCIYAYYMSYYIQPSHHMMFSLPFIVIGLLRYWQLMCDAEYIDCPVSLFLADKLSLSNLFFLLLVLVVILY